MSKPATPRTPPSFAALVQSFFTEHLTQQRAMSPRTSIRNHFCAIGRNAAMKKRSVISASKPYSSTT